MPIKTTMNFEKQAFYFFVFAVFLFFFTMFVYIGGEQKMYLVSKVIDGDTIKIYDEGKEKSVRLIGIDTPETYRDDECYGPEATETVEKLLTDTHGEYMRVKLKKDKTQSDVDHFGRLLRRVYVQNVDMGAILIKTGHAVEYTYKTPHEKFEEYKGYETTARRNGVGLHGQCS